jgi:nitrile hydratase subunit beta
MNGAHDLGGMHGFGPVEIEKDEPVFHSQWERRMFALNLACGFHGKWNLDMTRYAREQMPPAEYLATTYYEHWLFGLQKLLVEQELVTAKELQIGHADAKKSAVRAVPASEVEALLRKRRAARLDEDVPPRFRVGERVVARNINPTGHTRLPRYARGRRGVIDRDHGVFIFADTHAMSRDKKPQHCYSVRFTARELWGTEASARDSVFVDLWDDHLDPA